MRKITSKIFLLSSACCLIVSIMLGSVSIFMNLKMKEDRTAELTSILEQKFDDSIKNEVNSVVTALQGLYERSKTGEITLEEAKSLGASIIRKMRYGEEGNGYFWVDTYEGVNVVLAVRPEVEGTFRMYDRDGNGTYYIREMISKGQKDGGGYTNYWFPKPEETTPSEKRSYSLAFKPFNWVIGTGNYIDDMEKVISASQQKIDEANQKTLLFMSIVGVISLIVTIILSIFIGRGITKPILKVINKADTMAQGDLTESVKIKSTDEVGILSASLEKMRINLQQLIEQVEQQSWVKSNLAEITALLSGEKEIKSVTQLFLSKTVPLIGACQAAFFVKEWNKEENEVVYQRHAAYAYEKGGSSFNCFRLGEGLVGQAVAEKKPILLSSVPQEHLRIQSGLGESGPIHIFVLPVSYEGDVKGVIEFASFHPFTETQQDFLVECGHAVGIMLDSIFGRMRLSDLLQESQMLTEELQAQSDELQSQQEELRATNEELEEQTQALRSSEEQLQEHQEKLEMANTELREKAFILEAQNKQFEEMNKILNRSQVELEEKAQQLLLSSKYKSEFLANMSHELRTPLNSLLILSKLLSENKEGNLSDKQIQFAKTIYSSGGDLLTIINDLLDLAKIESGNMDVNASEVSIKDLIAAGEKIFRPVATDKGLHFKIHYQENLPTHLYTDGQRLQQVLRNLLSNAFKFTNSGEVTVEIGIDENRRSYPMMYFSVKDTGIGIPEEKQEQIFLAFQQADGTTSRKYGGTGLGLSICRELASLLGGEITLQSQVGVGSTFTFYIGDYATWKNQASTDNDFEKFLDQVKEQEKSQHLEQDQTVGQKIDTVERYSVPSIQSNRKIKRLLLVNSNINQRNSLMERIGGMDVVIKAVSTILDATEEMKNHSYDFVVVDVDTSDTDGFERLEKLKERSMNEHVNGILYTNRIFTTKEEMELKKQGYTIIMKDSFSPKRLVEELEFYLKKGMDNASTDIKAFEEAQLSDDLVGKRILLVDDDVRNVFAITNVLEPYGVQTVFAENGIEALDIVKNQSEPFDLILMDIMMPEMDGNETIAKIREMDRFVDLPIIALTAKAMKEDRVRSMEAGASDYMIKPVDPDKLVSLIRVWLFKGSTE